MFNFIKNKLSAIYHGITARLSSLFSRTTIDEDLLEELEIILLSADTGVETTEKIMLKLENKIKSGEVTEGATLKKALAEILADILAQPTPSTHNEHVILLIGINGSGKTTLASKLAHKAKSENKSIAFVAADTFRAAAPEQLAAWAKQLDIECIQGKPGQDPASVVFQGCDYFKQSATDTLIIDTAGRLQTKQNLMQELAKIKRAIQKNLPDKTITTILTIDGMLGQNSFEQAKLFQACTDVDAIALTKMDGTGKGGIVFSIADELKIPIAYISYGEKPEQLKQFDAHSYIDNLLTK